MMAEIDRQFRKIIYSQGFSPFSNKHLTDYQILKKADVLDMKIRTIQLMAVDFNMKNK